MLSSLDRKDEKYRCNNNHNDKERGAIIFSQALSLFSGQQQLLSAVIAHGRIAWIRTTIMAMMALGVAMMMVVAVMMAGVTMMMERPAAAVMLMMG